MSCGQNNLARDLTALGRELLDATSPNSAIVVSTEALKCCNIGVELTCQNLLMLCKANIEIKKYKPAEKWANECIALLGEASVFSSVEIIDRRGKAMTYLATVCWMDQRRDRTVKLLREVASAREKISQHNPTPYNKERTVEAIMNLIVALRLMDDYDSIFAIAKRSVKCVDMGSADISTQCLKNYAKICDIISENFAEKNDCYTAVKYSKLAIDATKKYAKNLPHSDTAERLRVCGRLYVAICKAKRAITCFMEALAIYFCLDQKTTEIKRCEALQELEITYKMLGDEALSEYYSAVSGKHLQSGNNSLLKIKN